MARSFGCRPACRCAASSNRRIARALIKDPGSPRDLDSWAAWVGVSRRNLTRVFRQQTGLSFGAWRRRLRLLEAAARLADGESLDRIVSALGHSSVEAVQTMQRREADRAQSYRARLLCRWTCRYHFFATV